MPVHLNIREWQRCSPGQGHAGKLLRGRYLDAQTRHVAQELCASGKLIVRELASGLEIETRSHVGRIALGELIVTIEPKLAGPCLLRLLRYVYGLRDLKLLSPAQTSTRGELLVDLMAMQLAAEARELVNRGLHRAYRPVQLDLASPRGRIDIARLAARGGIQEPALPCRDHVRADDWLLNQVLAAGLDLAAGCAEDSGVRAHIRGIARLLPPGIARIPLSWALLGRAERAVNRLSAAYQPALRLIEILYAGGRISLDEAEDTAPLPGFLFDMNRFFQALLARFLSDNLPGGHELREEHALRQMFRYSPDANPRSRPAPTPRPDFAIARAGRIVALLDAKYRDLWERSLPREMLYQLALYALSQSPGAHGSSEAIILYPAVASTAREARIEVRDPVLGSMRASVVLRPVRLAELEAAISGSQAERAALARMLVFGESSAVGVEPTTAASALLR